MLRRQGIGQKRHLPKGLEPRSVTSSLALMALGPWTNHFHFLAITFPSVNKGMGSLQFQLIIPGCDSV